MNSHHASSADFGRGKHLENLLLLTGKEVAQKAEAYNLARTRILRRIPEGEESAWELFAGNSIAMSTRKKKTTCDCCRVMRCIVRLRLEGSRIIGRNGIIEFSCAEHRGQVRHKVGVGSLSSSIPLKMLRSSILSNLVGNISLVEKLVALFNELIEPASISE